MTLNTATQWLAELALKHRLVVKMEYFPGEPVKIQIPRNLLTPELESEIKEEAEKRGYVSTLEQGWLTFRG